MRELNTMRDITEGVGRGLNIFQEQADKMAKLTDAMQKGIITADGFTAAQRKLNEEFGKKASTDAMKVFQDLATPLDKLRSTMEDMDGLLGRGLIGPEQRLQRIGQSFEELTKATDDFRHAGAMNEGSREAYEQTMKFEDSMDPAPPRRGRRG